MIDRIERLTKVYWYMFDHHEQVNANEYFGPGADAVKVEIWRGYCKDIAESLELTPAAIYETIQHLVTMDCLSMVIRGTKTQKSIYLIEQPPSADTWERLQERNAVTGRYQPVSKQERNKDAINRLRARVDKLERRLEMLERGQIDQALHAEPAG